MYSQKCVQYCSGGFLGGDKERTLYKVIVISMIVSLKKYIPCFATSLPEASTSGHWLSRQTNRCIHDLKFTGSLIIIDQMSYHIQFYGKNMENIKNYLFMI